MTSSAFLTVPVRANVTGVYIHKDGSTKPINHVYEFNAFTGSLDINEKATVFEVNFYVNGFLKITNFFGENSLFHFYDDLLNSDHLQMYSCKTVYEV